MKPVIRKPGEDIEYLIRRFRRRVDKEGILNAYRGRMEFVKPSEQQRKKRAAAVWELERQRAGKE